jgi:hypothetical protein
MTDLHSWMIWPDNTALSVLTLLLIAMIGLYAARTPMHGLIPQLDMRSPAPFVWGRAGSSPRPRG